MVVPLRPVTDSHLLMQIAPETAPAMAPAPAMSPQPEPASAAPTSGYASCLDLLHVKLTQL